MFAQINSSAFIPGKNPVRIHYRDKGQGAPMLFLHGAWGYGLYPFSKQIRRFGRRFRILIPDRVGFGRSDHLKVVPAEYHRRSAEDMLQLLDALGLEKLVVWGHSDGAVVAAFLGLLAPERCVALVLEACHYYRLKNKSGEFFHRMISEPEGFGSLIVKALASEHGEPYWRELLKLTGKAWFKMMSDSEAPSLDLFKGQMANLQPPVLLLHGENDPWTESHELDALAAALGQVRIKIVPNGRHSPHSETQHARETNDAVDEFLQALS